MLFRSNICYGGSYFVWAVSAQSGGFIQFTDGAGSIKMASSLGIGANQWIHVGVTFAPSSITFYVNGVSKATPVTTGTNIIISNPMYVGSIGSSGGFFQGDIANVKLHSKTFTAAEILQDFNSIRDRYGL